MNRSKGAFALSLCLMMAISNTLPKNINLNDIAVFNYGHIKLIVVQGIDITKLPVKVIVNAANAQLSHGGGVARVINNAAGCLERVDKEALEKFKTDKKRAFATGDALIVDGCALKERGIKNIVHAVGPNVDPTDITDIDKNQLACAYINSLIAVDKKGDSVAFPTISTNIFQYPVAQATPVALQGIKKYIDGNPDSTIKEIWFAIYGDDNQAVLPATQQEKFDIYLKEIPQVFEVSKIDNDGLKAFIMKKKSHSF